MIYGCYKATSACVHTLNTQDWEYWWHNFTQRINFFYFNTNTAPCNMHSDIHNTYTLLDLPSHNVQHITCVKFGIMSEYVFEGHTLTSLTINLFMLLCSTTVKVCVSLVLCGSLYRHNCQPWGKWILIICKLLVVKPFFNSQYNGPVSFIYSNYIDS